jgi:hypothetical protein
MPLATGSAKFRDMEEELRSMQAMQAEVIDLAPYPTWIGYVTPDEDRRHAESWAKAMGTGYPSPVEPSGLVDQGHQNPSGETEGQEVEAAGAGDAETGEHKKHEAEDE